MGGVLCGQKKNRSKKVVVIVENQTKYGNKEESKLGSFMMESFVIP
jgi:hypothetical protein